MPKGRYKYKSAEEAKEARRKRSREWFAARRKFNTVEELRAWQSAVARDRWDAFRQANPKPPKPLRKCLHCGIEFIHTTAQQRCCTPEHQRKRRNQTNHRQYERNPQYRMRKRLQGRLLKLLNGQKSDSTRNIIGCDLLTLRKHLQSRFLRGMSWENDDLWHIDHVVPCADHDLTDPEQVKKCFHYSNLRPLWSSDNHAKGAKIIPCQPEFPMNITHSFSTTAIGVTPRRAA